MTNEERERNQNKAKQQKTSMCCSVCTKKKEEAWPMLVYLHGGFTSPPPSVPDPGLPRGRRPGEPMHTMPARGTIV